MSPFTPHPLEFFWSQIKIDFSEGIDEILQRLLTNNATQALFNRIFYCLLAKDASRFVEQALVHLDSRFQYILLNLIIYLDHVN